MAFVSQRKGRRMGHRQYFDQHAEKWDTYKKPDEVKLKRVIESASIEEGSRVLDIGTGTGILLPFLVETVGWTGSVVALDLSFEMLKHARAKNIGGNIAYVQADAGQLPFKGSKFDRVICFACFPHFTEKASALAEIAKTLTKDGVLVIAHAGGREKINAMHTSIGGVLSHDLIPENTEMQSLLKQAGFQRVCIFDETDFYLVLAEKWQSMY